MTSTATVEGFRLSPQQRRLWTLQNAESRAHLVLQFDGELHSDKLRAALETVCSRHQSLRSVFHRLPGVALPVQSVNDDVAPSWQATFFTQSPVRHVLSISMPALCADNRTLDNLFTELTQCLRGEEIDTEPLQYLQFAEWQNTLAEEEEAKEGREYWSKQDLTGASSTTLPGQRRSTRGDVQSVKVLLSHETTTQIAALAQRYETSSAIVLLAAWQALLWRLTRQPIVVGNICDGRPYELLHDAFGLFARALPSSCRFTDDLRFAEVITQMADQEREAIEWQDYFEWNQTSDSATDHFTFGYEHTELPLDYSEHGLHISVLRRHCTTERFELKLTSTLKAHAVELEFEYNTAAFNEANIRHLAGQFQTLLTVALANPESLVAEFEIVSDADRQQIVFNWNATQREYLLDQCLHQLFEQQVERTPDRPAIVFKDRQLTFHELNQRANQLAHYLKAQSIGPEAPVALCVESSLEMIVGVLGILKAGGAYLPLDPRNPDERINQVLRDAGASVVLTQGHQKRIETQSIALDKDWETKIAAERTDNPTSATSADNLAYVIYTSGSTGQPKGVMIQHRSAANLAAALREEVYANQGAALKVGLGAPLAFDASVKQWLQLLSGHTLYLLPEELRLDAVQLLAYLDQHALDLLDCTPSQLKLLLAAGFSQPDWNRPKMMLIGGEAVDESLWSTLAAGDESTLFQNVYGPTECTVDTTWANVQSAPERPTIGRPLPNIQTYILDGNLKLAGINITGELYVGGNGVGRGYLNRPELTAEKFVPDFLSGNAGARLYRTGDLARYRPDGAIEFLGRNDSQVKIRGHRIELGEIEAVVRRHEQVRQVAVMAREDVAGDVRLVAYVVPKETGKLDVSELRGVVSERMPDYMSPTFVVLDELPLTRNGKVDLKSLPAPETVRTPSNERYVAPRNEIEETITRIWQEALRVDRIGVDDNFFEVGGHSLLMVQVHSKLSELFGNKLTIVEMFAKPTISALAEHLGNGNGHKPTLQKAVHRAERRKQAAGRRKS